MNRTLRAFRFAIYSLVAVSVTCFSLAVAATQPENRATATKAMQDGNWKDAYEIFAKLATDPEDDPMQVSADLNNAIACLQRLGRVDEADDLREKTIAAHKDNWRLLFTAAQSFQNVENYGFIVAGKFYRGGHRGNDGRQVSAVERDRVRSLQLMEQAAKRLLDEDGQNNPAEIAQFWFHFADMLMNTRYGGGAWQLQSLTDLTKLPDYDDMSAYYGYRHGYGGGQGAPVDEKGNVVYHQLPKTWETAKTDGERWRWTLMQAAEVNAEYAAQSRLRFAQFLQSQFDVTTMLQWGYGYFDLFRDKGDGGPGEKDEAGPYELSGLAEDETIAQTAVGIKRFELPDEFNFIKIYQDLNDTVQGGAGEQAGDALAQVFEDRQQYPRAAGYWQKQIAAYGPGPNNWRQQRLDQIVGNWGNFEQTQTAPAGKELTLPFLFRNGTKVSFTAHALNVKKLLEDVKGYIRSKPAQLDGNAIQIENIGWRIIQQGQREYIDKKVGAWEMALEPRDKHFDKRVTVKTPIKDAGAYLIEATMENGNTSRVVAWVADTVIVKKQADGGTYCFVGDAVSGAPVERAAVEFFGWRQRHLGDNKWQIDLDERKEASGADGGLTFKVPVEQHGQFQYLIIATTDAGRFAFQGFTGIWHGSYENADHPYNQQKVFLITDRPVYRPGQSVKFKFWVSQAKYDMEGNSPYAGQFFNVVAINPRGEKMFEQQLRADGYGGFNAEIALGDEAMLGAYNLIIQRENTQMWQAVAGQLNIGLDELRKRIAEGARGIDPQTVQALQGGIHMGGGSFRVEEYKKPEFEVTVEAPTEPVMLGEKITATIKAKYYFGAPVVNAKVKYKVLRSRHDGNWFPAARWDWMYEPGYWWFQPNRVWFPGFERWGCFAPYPWWYGRAQAPPEVVLQNEVPVGKDGTVKVEIDTALAKAVHGDQDHKYEISAEITDESRRTIVGSGNVTVAREPFKVYTWTDRGHYTNGDVVAASFKAQTLDQKPVKGKGVLKLLKVTYDAKGKLVEEAVKQWELDTNQEGDARLQLKAAAPGQYRLSYSVTDEKKHAIEGGYLFMVRGEDFDGTEYRFNDIELITDRKEYRPGDKVRLMINTNRKGGTVALFTRPVNGMYLPPTIIRLDGKSTVREIEVSEKDMPNFFMEAFTVADGRVYEETREVVVPPESRVIDVKVTPTATKFQPGQKAKFKVQLTDPSGEPVAGSAVVSIYDKSVEYISGGSNVGSIKEFFWKWRRHHQPQTETTLHRWSHPAQRAGEPTMGFLGRFGALVADQLRLGGEGGGPGGGGGGLVEEELAASTRGGGFKLNFNGTPPPAPTAAAGPADAGAADGLARREISNQRADKLMDRDFKKAKGDANGAFGQQQGQQGGDLAQPSVRKNFADTALWSADITTGKDGTAEVELDMPENLTTWKAKVWSMGSGTRVGEGSAEVVTYKNLLVRLQAPRFFTQKDEVVLSANVHNYLKTKKKVKVQLELTGPTLQHIGLPGYEGPVDDLPSWREVEIEPEGEKRVDFLVKVLEPGEATVKMAALTDEESDAMQMSFPVYVHGMLKTDSYSGAIRPDGTTAGINIRVPEERLPEQSRIEVRYSPSVAAAMVDALPYLADFPYGCTEQTLNRFVPSVITRKTLLTMGLDLKAIGEKRTNLNAQEIGDDPKRAEDWKRKQHANYNPVFDEAKLDEMIREGVTKLANQQIADGGWGWFSGFGEQSGPHTTAVVVHGLQVARDCDVQLPGGMLERGIEWLKRYQAQQVQLIKNHPNIPSKRYADDMDAFVYMVLADENNQGNDMNDMREFLFRDRNELAVYSKAVYGVALHKQNHQDKLRMIMENIRQFVVEDDENQTAYLKLPEGNYWWYWYGTDTEANAWYLKLLSKVDPKGQVASRLSKYMINNRKHATYWNSTRDTAYSVEALGEFVKASEEDKPDMTVQVLLDGKKHKEVKITADNFFSFDNKLVLEGKDVPSGEHKIEFVKTGKGPLYFNAYVTNFTLEDPITKAGLEIKVQRKFYKLVPVDKSVKVEGARGQALDQKVEKYERQALENLDTLKSGDLVEVELEIDSKNDYEYVVFEDMKAAGFEPVETQSGYNGNDLNAYMELRDERVCFFARTLARGKHSVAYKLRAEIPGKFSALPTRASAMYAPELRANSDENKLNITD